MDIGYSTEAKIQLMILIDGRMAPVSWHEQISLLTNSKEVDKHPTVSKFRAPNERHDVVKIQKTDSIRQSCGCNCK